MANEDAAAEVTAVKHLSSAEATVEEVKGVEHLSSAEAVAEEANGVKHLSSAEAVEEEEEEKLNLVREAVHELPVNAVKDLWTIGVCMFFIDILMERLILLIRKDQTFFCMFLSLISL